MKINENIALAKSILKKNGIEPDSEEYKDYLKVREIVGTEYAYIGILTRLRFLDNVTDMEELKSIYDVLKNSKLDLGKLRMSLNIAKITENKIFITSAAMPPIFLFKASTAEVEEVLQIKNKTIHDKYYFLEAFK